MFSFVGINGTFTPSRTFNQSRTPTYVDFPMSSPDRSTARTTAPYKKGWVKGAYFDRAEATARKRAARYRTAAHKGHEDVTVNG